mmetsp:Transcript_24171/g.75162  ORF Transcript_24171/g.75162 Transcript_24171/m.75162 type:complete len:304 (-) Transcript_24171:605-1516(-)
MPGAGSARPALAAQPQRRERAAAAAPRERAPGEPGPHGVPPPTDRRERDRAELQPPRCSAPRSRHRKSLAMGTPWERTGALDALAASLHSQQTVTRHRRVIHQWPGACLVGIGPRCAAGGRRQVIGQRLAGGARWRAHRRGRSRRRPRPRPPRPRPRPKQAPRRGPLVEPAAPRAWWRPQRNPRPMAATSWLPWHHAQSMRVPRTLTPPQSLRRPPRARPRAPGTPLLGRAPRRVPPWRGLPSCRSCGWTRSRRPSKDTPGGWPPPSGPQPSGLSRRAGPGGITRRLPSARPSPATTAGSETR